MMSGNAALLPDLLGWRVSTQPAAVGVVSVGHWTCPTACRPAWGSQIRCGTLSFYRRCDI